MTLPVPEWLVRRGGTLRLGSDGATWFAILHQQWEYSLAPVPVEGKFSCVVKQANNGRRVAAGPVRATQEEAVQAGLEELRKTLGW